MKSILASHHSNRRKPLILVGTMLLVGVLAFFAWKRKQAATLPAPPASPSAMKAASGSSVAAPEPVLELQAGDVFAARSMALTQTLSLNGTVKAVHSAAVKAKAAGELLSLTVREGDFVKAGQLIGQIDPTDYLARQKQAQEQVANAQAQLGIAQKTLENNQALVAQGFISTTALDTATKSVAAAQANVQAAVAGLDLSKKALNDSKIIAPISGQVAQRWAQAGERVNIEARIVDLVDKRQLELEAQLNAADLGAVRVGQAARVQLDEKTQLDGKVLRINPSVNANNRSVAVYVSLPSRNDLAPGMFLSAKLFTSAVPGSSAALVVVPSSAVRLDKSQPYVQVVQFESANVAHTASEGLVKHQSVVVKAMGEAQEQASSTGETASNVAVGYSQVSDLEQGTRVLTSKVGMLREGSKVKLMPAK